MIFERATIEEKRIGVASACILADVFQLYANMTRCRQSFCAYLHPVATLHVHVPSGRLGISRIFPSSSCQEPLEARKATAAKEFRSPRSISRSPAANPSRSVATFSGDLGKGTGDSSSSAAMNSTKFGNQSRRCTICAGSEILAKTMSNRAFPKRLFAKRRDSYSMQKTKE